MDDLPPEQAPPIDLAQCGICGRKFNPDTLERHESICLKNKKRDANRKPFDVAKQRAKGTELEAFNDQKKYSKTPADRVKMIAYERQAQKKKLWKKRHEEFVDTIRMAREYDAAAKTGVPLPPQPTVSNPDYVQCPYCKRRFQEHAAERHIPFCKEQKSRIERKTTSTTGTASLNKRLKYKPPVIRKRSGTEGTPSSNNHNPPGASIVKKKSNFSATYTVSENDGPNYYDEEVSGIDRRRLLTGSRSRNASANRAPVGGVATQHLPGSTPRAHKPHPPTKIAPSGTRTRLVHLKRQENSPHSVPDTNHHQHRTTNGYLSDDQDHSYPEMNHTQSNGRLRSRDREARDMVHGSGHPQSHAYKTGGDQFSDQLEDHQNQTYTLGALNPRRGSLQRGVYSENNSLSDSAINGFHSAGHNHMTSTRPPLARVGSDTISGGAGIPRKKKISDLNAHGMSMSKFCYECGSRFPVPQAKYCCECGTKRL